MRAAALHQHAKLRPSPEGDGGLSSDPRALSETPQHHNRCRVDAAVGEILAAADKTFCEYEAKPLLAAYGIQGAGERLATSRDDAAEIAEAMGGKLALKVQSPDILQKTEAGAVALKLLGGNEARKA